MCFFIFVCLLLFFIFFGVQDVFNVSFFGQYNFGDGWVLGFWSYVGVDGIEYVLLGVQIGIVVVEIGINGSFMECVFIFGLFFNWWEIMVVSDYVYVVIEGGVNFYFGMQVIDLSGLFQNVFLVIIYNF